MPAGNVLLTHKKRVRTYAEFSHDLRFRMDAHVSKHLERDIEALEHNLLAMSAQAASMICKAWRSVSERRDDLALDVIAGDTVVDAREVKIEEDCLKILSLHQPVAIDLRRVATILKVNNDLERIADLAVNIAECGRRLSHHLSFEIPVELKSMAEAARQMLGSALDALVQLDPSAARLVCDADDRVDALYVEVVAALYTTMRNDPERVAPAIHALLVGRNLERMADLATNIAEDVVYLVSGDIVRHRAETKALPPKGQHSVHPAQKRSDG